MGDPAISTPPTSIYWHDYETTGLDPRRDRPSQFAGVRTDAELCELAEPLVLYCHPASDVLPWPESCLITGISPQRMRRDGVPEREFAACIAGELAVPGSCAAAYNGFGFDFEVTRHLFYRNFHDPYAWEWRDDNSRWDPLGALRLARALRPEGIEWPDGEDGSPVFQQDRLTSANGIAHDAHEALSDVRSMIALARLLRQRQPKLFDYALARRQRQVVAADLEPARRKVLLHVDPRYGNRHCCLGLILPLAAAVGGERAVWVFDLSQDPAPLLEQDGGADTGHSSAGWSGVRDAADAMALGLGRELAKGIADVVAAGVHGVAGAGGVPGLHLLRFNRAPLTAPLSLLRADVAERWGIDLAGSVAKAERLLACDDWGERLPRRAARTAVKSAVDPEFCLYDGFWHDSDRDQAIGVPQMDGAALVASPPHFVDGRLRELLFRYRARNYPQSLDASERQRWQDHCYQRLTDSDAGARLVMEDYLARVGVLRETAGLDDVARELLGQLESHADELLTGDS